MNGILRKAIHFRSKQICNECSILNSVIFSQPEAVDNTGIEHFILAVSSGNLGAAVDVELKNISFIKPKDFDWLRWIISRGSNWR